MKKSDGIQILAEGRHLRLINDKGWEYVERRNCEGVVAIVAETDNGRVLLVEQYRQSMAGPVIELPAGLIGDAPSDINGGDSILSAAQRELFEETGYVAGNVAIIATGPSSTGLTNEVISFVQANDLVRKSEGGGIDNEKITVHEIRLAEIDAWLEQKSALGVHIDPRIYVGLYFLSHRRGKL